LVVPKEYRDTLGIDSKTPLEVIVVGQEIIIRRHSERCTFCGEQQDLTQVLNRPVCSTCIGTVRNHQK
jgi:transcriptional pleiotropic regulator of transition state genes